MLDRILPLIKKYGAAVVGLTLDKNGIPQTAEQRIAIARRILAAAELEFDERGYAGASMRKIVSRAETSLGNLYRYYANKEDLFLSIVTPVMDACINRTGDLLDVSLHDVESAVGPMVDFVAQHSRIFRIVENGPPEHYAAFLDRLTRRISQSLERYAGQHCPEYVTHIHNPEFFHAVGQGFVSVLRLTLEHYENRERTALYLGELLRFQFGYFTQRLALLEESERKDPSL